MMGFSDAERREERLRLGAQRAEPRIHCTFDGPVFGAAIN
jgi:hypothetical protein